MQDFQEKKKEIENRAHVHVNFYHLFIDLQKVKKRWSGYEEKIQTEISKDTTESFKCNARLKQVGTGQAADSLGSGAMSVPCGKYMW